jgi:hypothetical protein
MTDPSTPDVPTTSEAAAAGPPSGETPVATAQSAETPADEESGQEFVPNPLFQTGVVDTSGLGVPDISSVSPVLDQARSDSLQAAIDDLESDAPNTGNVVLGDRDKDEVLGELKAAQEAHEAAVAEKAGEGDEAAEAAEAGEGEAPAADETSAGTGTADSSGTQVEGTVEGTVHGTDDPASEPAADSQAEESGTTDESTPPA